MGRRDMVLGLMVAALVVAVMVFMLLLALAAVETGLRRDPVSFLCGAAVALAALAIRYMARDVAETVKAARELSKV